MLSHPSIRIGCSGWQYQHWRGSFYPAELPPSRWLEVYAQRFDTVEINNTFYRLPDASTFATWARRVPRRFVFAVKASRYLTHMKKLKEPEDPLRHFFARARHLDRALGPVLYQLPPRFPVNVERLRHFLTVLPPRRRHVFEFRDPSWYTNDVLALIAKHRATLCLHDMPGSASGKVATGPFVYARFHGPQKYGGSYSDEALEGWAQWLAGRFHQGCAIYAYFNNDAGGHAPRNATQLRDKILRHVDR